MIFLAIALAYATGVLAFVYYLTTGRATEDRLPRLSIRNQVKARVSVRKLKRSIDKRLEAIVRNPDDKAAQLELTSTQLSIVLGHALLSRDARLARAAQTAMTRLIYASTAETVNNLAKRAREAACWN